MNNNPDAPVTTVIRPAVWYWIIAIAGLLWFLMDASMWYMRVFGLDQMLAGLSADQQQLYSAMPAWVNSVFTLEVFGGLLGCLGLLLRRRWALYAFLISLLGVLLQTFYIYFLSDTYAVMGSAAIVMPLVAIAIGLLLLWLVRYAARRGWLR